MLAVVTGGCGGIGAQVCLRLATDGYDVAILDKIESGSREVTGRFSLTAGSVVGFEANVCDAENLAAAVRAAARALGPPSVLVTAAGVYSSAPVMEVGMEDWNEALAVNLTGSFNAARACIPFMRSLGVGSIVMISSTGGKIGWPFNHAYCASKAGVIGLMRVLALELARDSIRVNCVCPGNTDTPMMDAVDRDVSLASGHEIGWFKSQMRSIVPLGRMARPEEVADLAAFLCSERAAHITGQAINVDGGTAPS